LSMQLPACDMDELVHFTFQIGAQNISHPHKESP
jgi:hypothetical protein